MNKALPDFLSKMVNNPPQAGSGVHTWLFSVSRNLHAHMSPDAIVSLLEDRSANCGRRVTRREIENAVNSSLECAWRPIGSNLMGRVPPPLKRSCRGSEGLPGWPELDEEERDAVIAPETIATPPRRPLKTRRGYLNAVPCQPKRSIRGLSIVNILWHDTCSQLRLLKSCIEQKSISHPTVIKP
jgi:hypothetical protein